MHRLVLAFAVLVILALPGAASAKELERVVVCGPSECATFQDHKTLRYFNWSDPGGVPPSSSYYRVKLVVAEGGGDTNSWRILYDPARNVIRTTDETGAPIWRKLATHAPEATLARLDGMEPFAPAPAAKQRPAAPDEALPVGWLLFGLGCVAAFLATVVAVALRRRSLPAT